MCYNLIKRRCGAINKLTEKQKRFCDYYIETGNGTESAKKAGYKAKDLRVIASENLTKPNIKDYIQKKIEKKDKSRIASQDEVLELYTRIARGEEKDAIVTTNTKGEVEEIRTFPTLKERIKALDALAKRYGLDKKAEEKENIAKSIAENIDNLTKILTENTKERKLEDFE